MKLVSKKIVSLLLAVMMVLSLGASSLAAEAVPEEGVSPQLVCPHKNRKTESSIVRYESSAASCTPIYQIVERCAASGCPYIFSTETKRGVPQSHANATLISAKCDGRTQTWSYGCGNCGHFLYTTEETCRGGPHSGACRWLPL